MCLQRPSIRFFTTKLYKEVKLKMLGAMKRTSSAVAATASNPMYAKKTMAAPPKTPFTPKGAYLQREHSRSQGMQKGNLHCQQMQKQKERPQLTAISVDIQWIPRRGKRPSEF